MAVSDRRKQWLPADPWSCSWQLPPPLCSSASASRPLQGRQVGQHFATAANQTASACQKSCVVTSSFSMIVLMKKAMVMWSHASYDMCLTPVAVPLQVRRPARWLSRRTTCPAACRRCLHLCPAPRPSPRCRLQQLQVGCAQRNRVHESMHRTSIPCAGRSSFCIWHVHVARTACPAPYLQQGKVQNRSQS